MVLHSVSCRLQLLAGVDSAQAHNVVNRVIKLPNVIVSARLQECEGVCVLVGVVVGVCMRVCVRVCVCGMRMRVILSECVA